MTTSHIYNYEIEFSVPISNDGNDFLNIKPLYPAIG